MEKIPAVHPGEILLEEFIKPYGLTQYKLAKAIGVSQMRISEIVNGKRSITTKELGSNLDYCIIN